MITLVIIGIIAAITIPAISRSSEKYILRNQFKKSYSTIVNAMNKADTDLGGNTVCYYPSEGGAANDTRSDCDAFFRLFAKNLSIQKTCEGNAKAGGCIPEPWLKEYPIADWLKQNHIETINRADNLSDGTIIVFYNSSSNNYFMPLFVVDINGAKGPNELGKDAFVFYIISDGQNGLKISNNLLNWTSEATRAHPYFRYISNFYNE